MEQNLIYILPAFGIIGLIYMLFLSSWVNKQDAGDDKMKKLSGYIANGAMAFLKADWEDTVDTLVLHFASSICEGYTAGQPEHFKGSVAELTYPEAQSPATVTIEDPQ